mgnify:CR=1 FL=1
MWAADLTPGFVGLSDPLCIFVSSQVERPHSCFSSSLDSSSEALIIRDLLLTCALLTLQELPAEVACMGSLRALYLDDNCITALVSGAATYCM